MNKWIFLAFLGIVIMGLAFGGGIYLDSLGVKNVSFPMIMVAFVGGIIIIIGMSYWIEEGRVEEKLIKELRHIYKGKKTSKPQKYLIRFLVGFQRIFSPMILSFLIPFLIGTGLVILFFSFITGSVEGVLISVVLIPFLIWEYHWLRRERKKWKKFR